MSGKLNTTDLGGGGLPKTLQPGNIKCTISKVELEPFRFKEGAYHLVLHMEGPDLGSGFEGFFIDKDNQALGRHKGQVGRVNATEWAFADGTTKSGIATSRDRDILIFIKNLCGALGIAQWLVDQNNKFDKIEDLIKAFNAEKPFTGKALEYCLGGKEYTSKTGHTNHELFLPKFSKTGAPFSGAAKPLIKFDPAEHIRKKKGQAVSEFGEDTSLQGPASTDFELN